MLFKLHSLLKPLDMLRCNGIILPATQKEWTETREMLEKCSNTLKNITDLIEFKGETYCSVNNGLKDFTEKYNELENIQKRYNTKRILRNMKYIINIITYTCRFQITRSTLRCTSITIEKYLTCHTQ